jgi:hypothetical protein
VTDQHAKHTKKVIICGMGPADDKQELVCNEGTEDYLKQRSLSFSGKEDIYTSSYSLYDEQDLKQ